MSRTDSRACSRLFPVWHTDSTYLMWAAVLFADATFSHVIGHSYRSSLFQTTFARSLLQLVGGSMPTHLPKAPCFFSCNPPPQPAKARCRTSVSLTLPPFYPAFYAYRMPQLTGRIIQRPFYINMSPTFLSSSPVIGYRSPSTLTGHTSGASSLSLAKQLRVPFLLPPPAGLRLHESTKLVIHARDMILDSLRQRSLQVRMTATAFGTHCEPCVSLWEQPVFRFHRYRPSR